MLAQTVNTEGSSSPFVPFSTTKNCSRGARTKNETVIEGSISTGALGNCSLDKKRRKMVKVLGKIRGTRKLVENAEKFTMKKTMGNF